MPTFTGEAAQAAKQKHSCDERHRYVQLPPGFWTAEWHLILSGPALALLLVMLDITHNGDEHNQWISPTETRARYGSRKTHGHAASQSCGATDF